MICGKCGSADLIRERGDDVSCVHCGWTGFVRADPRPEERGRWKPPAPRHTQQPAYSWEQIREGELNG